MPSTTHRDEWNSLVPLARTRGLRVRPVTGFRTQQYGAERLAALRSLLGLTSSHISPEAATSDFTFGVEIEFHMPEGMADSEIIRGMTEAGVDLRYEGYNHDLRTWWKLVTDGSLGYRTGREIVSPPLSGPEGFAQIERVSEVLTRLRCKIKPDCGLHVHIGARDETLDFFKRIVRAYAHFEPVIDRFMARSRRGNNASFARSMRGRFDVLRLDQATTMADVTRTIGQDPGYVRGGGRYAKVNFQSYFQHGTVEFRQHGGTIEALKIISWVRLLQGMAQAAREGRESVSSDLDGLARYAGIDDGLRAFFQSRIDHFARRDATRLAA